MKKSRLLLVCYVSVSCVLVFSACSKQDPYSPTNDPGNTPTPSSTATSTITPSPSSTPAPTPEPGVIWHNSVLHAPFGERGYHSSIVFDGKMWVIGGMNIAGTKFIDCWFSSDGTNWIEATSGAFYASGGYELSDHYTVIYKNKPWLVGYWGNSFKSNETWTTQNGVSWNKITPNPDFSVRTGFQLLAFNQRLWVIGGDPSLGAGLTNDIWNCEDGTNWNLVTASAPFSGRRNHRCVVFDNKVWMIGGWDGGARNDVWNSDDGTNWNMVTGSASFGARSSHQCVAYDNRLWVVGGALWSGFTEDDVWSSTNGISWDLVTVSAGFPDRAYHQAITFENRIWVIGGSTGVGCLDDVWCSP